MPLRVVAGKKTHIFPFFFPQSSRHYRNPSCLNSSERLVRRSNSDNHVADKMNFRTRLYKPALLGLAAILFCLVGVMQDRLNVDRKALGLTRVDPLQNAPPVLAFTTVALGSFRGLIANALWMRLSNLQEEDKYFEMVQLADWITKLQPHMVQVWQFQAWNMAYNISVKFKSHEDRWHWVERGVELLRDDALLYNPNETRLYRDLSWLYQHKIGANLDDAHKLYKLRWAQEMEGVLGNRPDFNELLNPTTPEARERVRKLREVYKMDPKIVQQVDQEYGPFDWRLPDAHAVYWAEMGRIYAKQEDQETLRRSIYQSLQQMMFRGGALDSSVALSNVTEQTLMLWPNLDQIPTMNAAYEKMIAEEVKNPHGFLQNMQTAHKNFVKQAIPFLYVAGHEKQAQYWYNYVKSLYPNAFVAKEAGMTMEDYAVSQITEDIGETDMNKVMSSILGMFYNQFKCLILDNNDQAANYQNMAKKIWTHYHEKTVSSKERLSLKPLGELQQFALKNTLDQLDQNSPRAAAVLRTKLNLPPPQAPKAAAEPGAPAS